MIAVRPGGDNAKTRVYNGTMKSPDLETCAACKLGPPDWEYTCRNCLRDFTLAAARGPSEEKSRTCPACGSRDIARLNIAPSEANCAPGG
jgi:DNA-directed RNA polymerase subunit RPC12/RpoP